MAVTDNSEEGRYGMRAMVEEYDSAVSSYTEAHTVEEYGVTSYSGM